VASPTPVPYHVATGKSSYISNGNQNPRKPLAKVGGLERLVLLYASVVRRFTISDIVVAYNLKQEYPSTANRRVYDSVQRLVRRGFIRKVDRGIYELAIDISPDLLKDSTNEVESKENLGGTPVFLYRESKSSSSKRNCNVLRIHFRGVSGYLELYRKLQLLRCYLDVATRRLESYLISLGVSKNEIRRLRKYRYMCVEEGVVIGAHGRYKCRSKPLVPASGGFFYELGVDIFTSGLGKVFAKVYTDVLPSPFGSGKLQDSIY
jgi:hypothetical protein